MAGDKFSSGWDQLMRDGAKIVGETVKGIVAGIGELGGKLFSGSEHGAEVASESRGESGFMSRMKEALTGASLDVKEPHVQQVEISAPVKQHANHVDMAELGNFAPPALPTNAGRGGAGMGM